jgi:hypothetical protein
MGDPWAADAVLTPKRPGGPRRVVLLGESTAAGWFYAPAVTPARVLERHLGEMVGDGRYEVVDLAKVDVKSSELLAVARASLQLGPDILLVVAGNNWPIRLQVVPAEGHRGSREAARVFREAGVPGLARLTDEATRRIARQALLQIGGLAREARVPVVLVVPEVNLRDWPRARPVAWLPGGGSARWHALRNQAGALLHAERHGEAAAAARAMIALDEGTCPTSHRLLATALLGLGDEAGASAASRAEADARAWDNFPSMPGATTGVQQALRRAAEEQGFQCVDLPAVFAWRLGSSLPGNQVLLDYCHFTLEGMRVAMAAVAAEIAALDGKTGVTWSGAVGALPPLRVPPEIDARAKFLAALYQAHWSSSADGRPPAIGTWLDAALRAWPGIADTMLEYAASRAAPADALLISSEQQRLLASSGSLPQIVWSIPSLDAEVLLAIGAALDRTGIPVGSRVADALVRNHAADGREIDLASPVYAWGPPEDRVSRGSVGASRAFHQSFWPSADFCLVAGGSRDVALELVARLPRVRSPREGSLELAVNGERVGAAPLTDRWTRHRLRLPSGLLRRGINRLSLAWPVLPPEGDEAIAAVRERLEQGLAAELHPVFGELSALRARPFGAASGVGPRAVGGIA